MNHIKAQIYNTVLKNFVVKMVKEDDRTYNAKCSTTEHEFAPGSLSCACKKYEDIRKIK